MLNLSGREEGRKVPALISTLENFLDTYAIPTKCGHFYENKTPEKFCVKSISCCHGNPIFDAMFSQIWTILILFSVN